MVRRVAVVVGAVSTALMVGGLVLLFIDRNASLPSFAQSWKLSSVLDAAVNLGTPALGVLLVIRRPENRIGWLFLLVGLVLGIAQFAGAYAAHALLVDPGSLPGGNLAGWISNVLWPLPFSALVLLFLWFPTGRVPSPRWRPVEIFTFALFGMLVAVSVIASTASWNDPFTNGNTGGPVNTMLGRPLRHRSRGGAAHDPHGVRVDRRPVQGLDGGRAAPAEVVRDRGGADRDHVRDQRPLRRRLGGVLHPHGRRSGLPLRGDRTGDPQVPPLRDRRRDRQDGRVRDARRVHHRRLHRSRGRHRRARGEPTQSAAVGARSCARRGGVPAGPPAGAAIREPPRLRQARDAVRGPHRLHGARIRDLLDRGRPAADGEDPRRRGRRNPGAGVAPRRVGAPARGVVAVERVGRARADHGRRAVHLPRSRAGVPRAIRRRAAGRDLGDHAAGRAARDRSRAAPERCRRTGRARAPQRPADRGAPRVASPDRHRPG